MGKNVQEAKDAKQQKRKENIENFRTKKGKRGDMRAGFEGKKQDFLNSNQEE